MKQLGPYKKYVVAAAIIQSIIVIIAGYLLFRAKGIDHDSTGKVNEKPAIEQPAKSTY